MSWRIRLLPPSAAKMTPAGETSIKMGPPNAPAVPKPLVYPAAPLALPAMVCTRPVVRLIARRRLPACSATYSTLPLLSRATPRGEEKVASAPTPLLPPAVPLPARVLTAAVAVSTRRTRLFCQSATYNSPLGCHTAEVGINLALVPLPSAKPHVPLPASVVTDAVKRSMARILQPSCSTMYAVPPSGVRTTPDGPEKVAAVPMPLLPPTVPLPASVVTSPDGEIRRMRLLP